MFESLPYPLPLLAFALPTLVCAAPQEDAEAHYRFLSGLCAQGQWELAVKEGRNFLEQFPNHSRTSLARYRLASALFELDRRTEAAEHFRPLAELLDFPFQAEVNLRLGQCALDANQLPVAREALLRAKNSDKDYLKAHANFLLGEVDLRAEAYLTAQEAYRASLSLDPKAATVPHAERGLLWCEFRTGAFSNAIVRAKAFETRYPNHELAGEVRFVLAEALAGTNDWKAAAAAYGEVPEGPFHASALRGLGFARAAQNDHVGAAEAFGALLQSSPAGPLATEARLHAGAHLLEAGQAPQALILLAQPADSKDGELLYWRAKALGAAQSPEQALPTLALARQCTQDPGLIARIETLRGEWLYELGRLQESAQAFEAAQTDYALQAAATAHLAAGRYDEALAAARSLAQRYPDSPYRAGAELLIAEALFGAGQTAQSEPLWIALYQATTRPDRERAQALSRYAWCRYLQNDASEAQKAFDRVEIEFAQEPQAEEALHMAARSALEAGATDEAVERWQKYLSRFAEGTYMDQALLGLGRALRDAASLQRLLKELPKSALAPEAALEVARLMEAASDWAAAADAYGAMLTAYPESGVLGDALYGRAWCLQQAGSPKEALPALLRLLRTPNAERWHGPAQELLLWCAVDAEDWAQARTSWSQLLSSGLQHDRLLAACQKLCGGLKRVGQHAAALAVLAPLEQPTIDLELRTRAWVEGVWIALDAAQLATCDAKLRAAAAAGATGPGLAEAAFFVGEAHYTAQDWPKAALSYTMAAHLEGSQVGDQALYKLGFTGLQTEDPAAAAEAFLQLTERFSASPLYGESLYLCGEARWRQGDAAGALVALGKLRETLPKHASIPKALFRSGQAQAQLGQHKEAQATLAQLVQGYGDFEAWAEAELLRGQALVQLDRAREARAAFDRVLARDKGVLSARARLEIGKLALTASDTEAALTEFLKVALLYAHPEEVAEALYRAGGCLEQRDDQAAALRQYQEAAQKHPKTPYGQQAAARLKELSR